MTWTLDFAPLIEPTWLIVLATLTVLVLVPGWLSRVRGVSLRTLAALALIVALANPILIGEDREALPTTVALVVDDSASQTLGDRADVTDAAVEALRSQFADFPDMDMRLVTAGDGAAGDGTLLFGPLAHGLADVPPEQIGALVLLTDGQVHDAPERAAALPPAPLHVILTGQADERDRRIVVNAAPRFGIVGELQTIEFTVIDDGGTPGTSVQVIIARDGETLAIETVRANEPTSFVLEVSHGGSNIIEIQAEPLVGELTEVNNRVVVDIEGIRENLRVLLVSGEPHVGERTWRNLLKSDAAVDLVHFTILRPPSKQDGTPINQLSLIAFPTRELFAEKIHEFDLIIFDRYHHRGVLPLLYFDNIARYVRDGGALLVAAGPDYANFSSLYQTPLSPVLPAAPTGEVIEVPFHARVTELGDRHPVTRALEGAESDPPDWGRFFRLIDSVQPNGNVLMSGAEEKPLLVLNREQEGRVALLLSDHTWLWARGFEGGGPHVDLLRRLAHWLMKEPDLEEEALRASQRGADLVVERQTMGEAGSATATIVMPSGSALEFEMSEADDGLWRATVPADEVGLYRVEQTGMRAFAHNGPTNPREFIDARSTPDVLAPLVEATGGHVARAADADGSLDLPRVLPIRGGTATAGSDWMGVRMTDASVLRGIDRVPVMTGLVSAAGLTGLLGLLLLLGLPFATWLREGR